MPISEDWLDPANACPADVCGSPSYDLKFKGGGSTDTVYTINLRCGQVLDGRELKVCGIGTLLDQDPILSHPGCLPVPEAEPYAMIIGGAILLSVLGRRRRRRVARQPRPLPSPADLLTTPGAPGE